MSGDKDPRTYSTADSTFAVVWVMSIPFIILAAIFILLVLCSSLRPRISDAAVLSLLLSRLLSSSGVLVEAVYVLEQWEWAASTCEAMLVVWMTSCLADVFTVCIFLLYYSARVRRDQSESRSLATVLLGLSWVLSLTVGLAPVYTTDQFDNFQDGRCKVGLSGADKPIRLTALLFYFVSALSCFVLCLSAISEANSLSYRYKLSKTTASDSGSSPEATTGSDSQKAVAEANVKRRIARTRDSVNVIIAGAGLSLLFNIFPQLTLYTLHILTGDPVDNTHNILLTLGVIHALSLPPVECWCSMRYYTVSARLLRQMCPRTRSREGLTSDRKTQSVQTVSSLLGTETANGDAPSANAQAQSQGTAAAEQVATPIMIVHHRSNSISDDIPDITVIGSSDNVSTKTDHEHQNGTISRSIQASAAPHANGAPASNNTLTTLVPANHVARSHSDCLARTTHVNDPVSVRRTSSSGAETLNTKREKSALQQNMLSSQEVDMIRAKSRATGLKAESEGSSSNTLKRISRTKRKNSSYVSSDYHHDSITDGLDDTYDGDSNSETWSNLYDEGDIADVLDSDQDGDPETDSVKVRVSPDLKTAKVKPKRKGKVDKKKTKQEKGLMASANFLASMTMTMSAAAEEHGSGNTDKATKVEQPENDVISAHADTPENPVNKMDNVTGGSTGSDVTDGVAGFVTEEGETVISETKSSTLTSNNPFLLDLKLAQNANNSKDRLTSPNNPFIRFDDESARQSSNNVNYNPFLASFAAETKLKTSPGGEDPRELSETTRDSNDNGRDLNGNPRGDGDSNEFQISSDEQRSCTEPPLRPPGYISRKHNYVNSHADPNFARRTWRSAAIAINFCKTTSRPDPDSTSSSTVSAYVTDML